MPLPQLSLLSEEPDGDSPETDSLKSSILNSGNAVFCFFGRGAEEKQPKR